MVRRSVFRVTVRYREPSYERQKDVASIGYRWTFRVEAAGEPEACRVALAEFRRVARESSVGWVREVTTVSISRVAP